MFLASNRDGISGCLCDVLCVDNRNSHSYGKSAHGASECLWVNMPNTLYCCALKNHDRLWVCPQHVSRLGEQVPPRINECVNVITHRLSLNRHPVRANHISNRKRIDLDIRRDHSLLSLIRIIDQLIDESGGCLAVIHHQLNNDWFLDHLSLICFLTMMWSGGH